MSVNHNKMVRKETYNLERILSVAKRFLDLRKSHPDTKVSYDGDIMKMASDRYKCFVVSGTKCICCGLEGQYFVKEREINNNSYHFNLYAVNDDGEEILMTKDHILPKSLGGKNHYENYQTMCEPCNQAKGNKITA